MREVTLNIGGGFFMPWLSKLKSARQLTPSTDLTRLTRNLAHLQYAVVQDWLIGALDANAAVPASLEAVLQMLSGAVRGQARVEVDRWLADVQSAGPRSRQIEAEAAAALAGLFGQAKERLPQSRGGRAAPGDPDLS